MATSDYFSSAYPEPWQVLGVSLLPFSFGHYLKLRRLGCAFVSEKEASATIGDLLLGIVVCSMRSDPDPAKDPFWQWLHQERPSGIRRLWWWLWSRKASPAEWDIMQWGRRVKAFDVKAKAELFSEYINHYNRLPAYVEEPSDTPRRDSGAHWAQAVIAALVSKCGYTLDEAYNAPMSKAWQDFFKHAESEGAVRLLPDEIARAMA